MLTLERRRARHGSSISTSGFAVTGAGRQTRVIPKPPVAGETTGEGCQMAEYRGQLLYFDLNFQQRIKDS